MAKADEEIQKIYAAAGIRNQFVVFDPITKDMTILETGNPLGNLEPFNDAWPGETGVGPSAGRVL